MNNTGSSLDSSISLDTTQQWQVIENQVGLDNIDDYYSFQLSNRSHFILLLNDLSYNADVRLLNHNGSEVAMSSNQGTTDEQINQILHAGTYFIQVHQVDDAEINYGLEYRSNYIPEQFQFNTETIEGGVRLKDTKIFDADGVNDLQKVDFWLRKQGESWEKLDDSVSEFSSNTDSSIGFNYDISNLEEGKYDIWVRATDNFGARSNGWKESFTVQNIVDSEVVNVAPSKLDFEIKEISGGIELTNTKVFDANGIDDLERVDFQLKKDDGEWIEIEDALDFNENQDGSIGFEYSISGLEEGKYELKATAYDKAGEKSEGLKTKFEVDNVAPTELEFEIETIESGVRVTDAKVFDANGIDDLTRIDFRLLKPDGSSADIADAVEFRSNENGSFSFDYSNDSFANLAKGTYTLSAEARDKANDYSNTWQKSFSIANTPPSQLDFDIKKIDGGIELENTQVLDRDGINDLEKVDFQLKKDDGELIEIEDALNFNQNQDGSIGFEYSISGLEEGKYELKATAYDKAGEKSEGLKTYFQVGNVAPTDLEFEIETIEGGVRVRDAKVFDANGIDDLTRIDFRLLKEDGSSEDIADAVEFRSNENGSFSFDYSIDSLAKGNYTLSAIARDKANDYSNTWQKSFSIANTAPSKLDFDTKQIDGGIELEDTQVFDANGINDLEKVDFQLKKDNGELIEIEDALNFNENQDGSIGFEYSISGLEEGKYELRATAYDKAGEKSEGLKTYFQVDNVAPTDLEFEIETIESGFRVKDAKVFDANGIDDLTRIDFWLLKPDGSSEDIADAVEFRSNENGSFSFDYSIDSLAKGNYTLSAIARDKADTYSNISQKSFQVQTDWFDENIKDTSIRTLSRSLFSDNSLNRNDAIAILRDAKDNGIVDATEINDLRTIIENASYLGMADYVRVLSDKVVNGDTANKSGNLQAGSSDVQLDKLINKWFLGSDRPKTSYTYQYAEGSLFEINDDSKIVISHDHIRQGEINDCFFLAALGATLVQSLEIIKDMFIDNGDGTFTVRFYNKGVADYVTVDRYLPTNDGKFVYANPGDDHENIDNVLWVALAEKAYAQVNESGWIHQDGTNSYNGIGNDGYLSDAFSHITGKESRLGRKLNSGTIVDAFNSGEVVGFGSKSSGVESNIVTSHAYALVAYTKGDKTSPDKFTLLNPWDTDNSALKSRTLELSWDEIISNFSYWDSTISNPIST